MLFPVAAILRESYLRRLLHSIPVAVYWGQNSYGATNGADTANWQQRLSFYCNDDAIDVFPMAFLNVFFGTGGVPSINLANTCNPTDSATFPGTTLPDCSSLASDITTCQSKGKIVTISLGGATGAVGFSSDAQATTFAQTIWDLFLGGSSSTRPFGTAVLDGIDLDIEGGSSAYYNTFVNQIRSLSAGASKRDSWARTTSPNPNVKIYIGAPASSSAAGSGYVPIATLSSIATQMRESFPSFGGVMLWDASQAHANSRYDLAIKNALSAAGGTGFTYPACSASAWVSGTNYVGGATVSFGGYIWQAKWSASSQPISSPNGDWSAISACGGATVPTSSSSSTVKPTSTSTTTQTTTNPSTTSTATATPTSTSGSCAGVSAWSSTVAYTGGSQVVYNSHLWTANYWSEADVPGGASGDWTDDGPCSSQGALQTAKTVAAAANVTSPPAHESDKPSLKSRFFRL
ncbi:class III chitinase [Pholiota molesta]|nr:class III chitinase [Pholiota molesta]